MTFCFFCHPTLLLRSLFSVLLLFHCRSYFPLVIFHIYLSLMFQNFPKMYLCMDLFPCVLFGVASIPKYDAIISPNIHTIFYSQYYFQTYDGFLHVILHVSYVLFFFFHFFHLLKSLQHHASAHTIHFFLNGLAPLVCPVNLYLKRQLKRLFRTFSD